MTLSACIVTLLVVYPAFLALGIWFFRHMQRTRPQPCPPGDPRNRFIKQWRFAVHVVLLPLAVTLSLAVLGALDPLFYVVAGLR